MTKPRPKRVRPIVKRRRPVRGRLPTPEEAEALYLEIDRRLAALAERRARQEENARKIKPHR